MDYKGIGYLRSLLVQKRERVLLRYKYYNSKDDSYKPSFVIPPNMKSAFRSNVGWCGKAVDSIVDRLVYNGVDNDLFNIGEIFGMNNPSVFFRSAIQSALVAACAFVYVTPDEDGYPRMQVLDAGNATGRMDIITGMLKEGYAVLERGDHDEPITEAYFTHEETQIISGGVATVYRNETGYPLLVPVVFRPDAERPFGHSRISRACMSLQEKAKDTLTRADVTAEFYSFPQKYILGMDPEAEPLEKYRASISSFLQFDKDPDGGHPVLGQFNMASMTPHLEQFKLYASAFAGETGLTLDDLGFVSENPSSAEAIKASHDTLVNTIEGAKITLGAGLLNAGFVAACLRDKMDYNRKALYQSSIKWLPTIKADAAMLSAIGDGIIKINQSVPEYFDKASVENLTGIKAAANGGYRSGSDREH